MIQNVGRPGLHERFDNAVVLDRIVTDAVRAALRRHMLLGESGAVSDENGGVKILDPEDIRQVLEKS